MSDSTGPRSLAERFFQMSLFVFGGIVLLSLSIDLLCRIWPWILGIVLVALTVAGLIWWHRQRNNW